METNSTPNHTELSSEVLNSVESAIVKTGDPRRKKLSCDVSLTQTVGTISDLLAMRVNLNSSRDVVSSQDIRFAFTALTALRVLQCNDRMPRGIKPRNVLVPDIFVPFLAAINSATLPDIGVDIDLVLDKELGISITSDENLEDQSARSVDISTAYDMAEKTIWTLQTQGVRCTRGLPKSTRTSDDTMFRIRLDEDGVLWAAGREPGSAALLMRAVINMAISEEIFGCYRTRYLSLEDIRPSIDMIVAAAFAVK